MSILFWVLTPLALLSSAPALSATERASRSPTSPEWVQRVQPRDTTWRQTARLQVPLSDPQAAAVLDAMIGVLKKGGIDEARRHPSDTTRRALSALRSNWPTNSAEGLSQATHLVLGYQFVIAGDGFQETLRSITVVSDRTEECDARYTPLLSLDATRPPVHTHLSTTEVAVEKAGGTQTYPSVTAAVRFAEMYEKKATDGARILTIGGDDACGKDPRDLDTIFWNEVIIAR